MLAKSKLMSLTYREAGASLGPELPSGFHHVRMEQRIGGFEAFDTAVTGLRTWAPHEGAGVQIYPDAPLEPDGTVIVVASFGPLQFVTTCRIVRVCKESDAFGFAYGTLPEHPETGEESFVVRRRDNGTHLVVTAFSKPADTVFRLAGPIGRVVQRHVTRAYLAGLRDYTSRNSPHAT